MLNQKLFSFLAPAAIAAMCIVPAQAAPQYPFPQQVKYKYGNTATYVDPSVIQTHFNDWKSAWYEDMGNGTARVISPNDSAEMTVSEGVAYGMMIMVYMSNAQNDHQSEFDKLWAYWKKYAVNAGSASGMNWHINNKNGNVGSGSASDADIDAAFALIMASKQWGNATYLNDAKTLISWMKSKDMESDGRVKAGSNWNPALNSSYVIPAAFKLFAEVTGDSFWETAITTNLKHVSQCQNANSGLMPDWCDWSSHKAASNTGAQVSGGDAGFFDDAARTPWRMAMAYNWYGIKEAKDINDKIIPWLDRTTYGNANFIWPGYNLEGTGSPYSFFTTSTFVGGLGLAMGSADNPKNYLESVYTVLANSEGAKQANSTKGEKYYPATLNILYLLSMSGNMPNLNDMASAEKYTLSSIRLPQMPAGTLMPVNSGASLWGYENWGTFADKYGTTLMMPDSGSSGLFLLANGKYCVSAEMFIAPEPTYEAGKELIYPFAGIALSFDKKDGYYDLTDVAKIRLSYASQGVIRFAILDQQTILNGDEGGEAGYFLHPTDGLTIDIDVTEDNFGMDYEDYLLDKFVTPSWVGGGADRDAIMKAVRGFKFEPKMSKGGFGSISISSFELLDAQGKLITKLTNGDMSNINLKPATVSRHVYMSGSDIVYTNLAQNTRLDVFDMNGTRVASKKLELSGSVAIDKITPAKGNYVATVRGKGYKRTFRIHR